jgi:hypothetical protein
METANKPLSASYYKTKGRFNWASNEQEWQVVLRASNGMGISELWPLDEEPEIDGLPPSEVVEIIAKRLESYWINTEREAKRKKVEWFRQHAELIDSGWARNRIEGLRKQIDDLSRYVLDADTEAERAAALGAA